LIRGRVNGKGGRKDQLKIFSMAVIGKPARNIHSKRKSSRGELDKGRKLLSRAYQGRSQPQTPVENFEKT